MKTRILFLLPYPLNQAPSQRFRVEAYFDLLRENKINFDTHVFLNEKAWKILYQEGSSLKKGLAVLNGFLSRMRKLVFDSKSYHYIFIHREASPVGPPIFEWWIRYVLRKKIIYDFDDAIWIPNVSEENKLAGSLKCYWKVKKICKWAYKISAGNDFLVGYAKQYNDRVFKTPTCVDTTNYYTEFSNQDKTPITIGWTGSHSTLPFLEILQPVFNELVQMHSFTLRVICNKPPSFTMGNMEFIKWNAATEISDLAGIQIGLMPLKDDNWSEGKCGFKIIQYMALGIPALASPVGVNKKIIEHEENGYLCTSKGEWIKYLSELITNINKRKEFARKGRILIEKEFSVAANAPLFLSLFSK